MFLRTAWFCLAVVSATALAARADGQTVFTAGGPLSVAVSKDHIDFVNNGKLMARYEHGPGVAKPYFWPLNAPTGEPITRAWPMEAIAPNGSDDHVHQSRPGFATA